MHYQVNPFYRTSAAQLDRTIAFLSRQPENFLLIGDSSILYGLTGKPSVSPSLWFHDGLTAPPPDCEPCELRGADLDGDNDVDLADFATFAVNYGS